MAETPAAGVAEAVMAEGTLAASLFDALRRDGLDEPGVTRDPYGPGEQRAHATAAAAAERLGLRVERDFAANTYMTLPGRDAGAPRVVVGSHLDSVPHGGNFDGAAVDHEAMTRDLNALTVEQFVAKYNLN